MKKIIAMILCTAVMIFSFCSCLEENVPVSDGRLKVVTTIFPSYDFAKNAGGDFVNVSMLLKPGMESHSYDPTPQDIISIQECDLFIYTGGESDQWVKDILESGDSQPKRVLAMMNIVDTVEEEIVEGMEEEEEEEEENGEEEEKKGDEIEYDEHVWTSPKNAMEITLAISKALSELDRKHQLNFNRNAHQYCQELSKLDKSFKNIVKNAERTTLVFGDRFPFRYFADEYGLEYYAAFPGCSSETEPSPSTVSFLIDKVKEEEIPVVFSIEFSNGQVADTICESTGAKKLTFHSCHNVTQEEFDEGVSYLSLMQANAEVLKEALGDTSKKQAESKEVSD